MFNSKWLAVWICAGSFLLLSQVPGRTEMLRAGTRILNGGDSGIAHQIDSSGDVCVSYKGDDFATITTSNVVELKVGQGYGLRVNPAAQTVKGNRGKTVSVDYTLENTGNGMDTVKITVISPVWEATASVKTVVLVPGEKKTVTVKINIPVDKKTAGKSSTITLAASSSGRDNWGDADEVRAETVVKVNNMFVSCGCGLGW